MSVRFLAVSILKFNKGSQQPLLESGSGKSTAVKLLVGLHPHSGHIKVDGRLE